MTSVKCTVGKLDAGIAVLLTEDLHLIEFPSLLLPKGVTSGSIVNISVNQNISEEEEKKKEYYDLQEKIMGDFSEEPTPPVLQVTYITQTTLTLEWKGLDLKKAKLLSLDIFQDGEKKHKLVPEKTSHKITGLSVDHEFEFHIVIKTTAGQYQSNKVRARTHKLDDLTGIRVAFGEFEEPDRIQELQEIIKSIGATWTADVDNETTHLIAQVKDAKRGTNHDKAAQFSIPIVKPDWLLECQKNNKIQAVLPYYVVLPANNS